MGFHERAEEVLARPDHNRNVVAGRSPCPHPRIGDRAIHIHDILSIREESVDRNLASLGKTAIKMKKVSDR